MIKKYLIFFSLIILFQNHIYSQIKISGQIKNDKSNPIEFVEIQLQDKDSIIFESELTDDAGKFIIGSKKGEYTLLVRQMGKIYHKQKINASQDINLGIITIIEEEQQLNEIVIISKKKKLIERKVDRLVFNVENSVAAIGGNGLDALKLTPRIKVQNDQISMIGKGSMRVMINDRIIQISDDDLSNYLKSLNSDDIKSIEVIANPPARHSAEGNSGLINIVLKKSKKDAWNASLRSIYQQATYAKGTAGGAFNMQKGKLQLNTNIRYVNGSNARVGNYKIYYPNTTWDQKINKRDYVDYLSAGLELEYKINDKLSTGINYQHVNGDFLSKNTDKTNLFAQPSNTLDSLITTKARDKTDRKINRLNYHFIYDIDTIGRKLSLDLDYFDYKNKKGRVFETQSFYPDNQPISNSLEEARNFGNQDVQNYSLNIDMEHPTDWASLNYGGRISFTETDNLFNYFNIVDNEETLNPNSSNEFNYKENTQALYFSIKKNFSKKWEAKMGLRYEFTQTEGFSKTINETNTNNYSKLFPTVYVSYTPNDNHSFSLNYGKRIKRPGYQFLNPFKYVSNPYSYSEGNPFLQPAFTNNIELEYSFKDNFITNVYYSYTDDGFEQVSIIDVNTNIERAVPLNFIVNKMFGVNQTIIFKPFKWWNINTSINIYYSSTDSKIPITLQYLSGWNGEFEMSNNFNLNSSKTLLANINFNYITKGVDNLDYSSNSNQLNASIKWLLLDKNLILSLYANDIFSSNRMTYMSYSNNIKNTFINYNDEQYFRLSIIYNFGKKFETISRSAKNQEEQNRAN